MKTAAFGYRTRNLGDDMQTIAAMLQLGRLDALVDRDALADESLAEPHALIFNSWHLLSEDYRLPPPMIKPFLHGLAIYKKEWLTDERLTWLRAHGPVGCRDKYSLSQLRANDVPAYWSGCLTLFMGDFFAKVPLEARQEVLFVDVGVETEERFIPESLRRDAIRLTMEADDGIKNDRAARILFTARLAERLRCAKLIVTRRLHVALPAVGFGTPVVALPDASISRARRRFSGFDAFLTHAYQDDQAGLEAIQWSDVRPSARPHKLAGAVRRLRAQLDEVGCRPYARKGVTVSAAAEEILGQAGYIA